MHPSLSSFFLDGNEPIKSCLLALREILLQFDSKISETKKYGMPCYQYQGKAFCYLWTDKKSGHPYILVVEGRQIDHPALEQGTRARMKILPIDPQADIPIHTIQEVLSLSKALYDRSIK
ncbi:DUF1801 domain-containing protein [Reichenbachiella carrageenanivorans]|uniref:DUF1801 domain-containing protein n=1 Tax=Reichenbachiella carrageenanivorans TaxID=2979869 RepID=A0ABY6CYV9_9BACT|nr:DUF1801 domain-containing protein [Reichenbachiella carrageenanivorans]UXX79105.1 DUF1801 domain-containing protein [Reichenbachiella carrageenanivorans]